MPGVHYYFIPSQHNGKLQDTSECCHDHFCTEVHASC